MYGDVAPRVAVIGAGSFGTALAAVLAQKHGEVRLWVRSRDVADAIAQTRENTVYLPGFRLPPAVLPMHDLEAAVSHVDLIVLAVPSHAMREITARLPRSQAMVVCASKGLEIGTDMLLSDVLAETLPSQPKAFLSGPSFAREVADGQLTNVVIAAYDEAVAARAQRLVSMPMFRCYTSTDVVGVEIAGALKNVLAIAAGGIEGIGLGLNARAGLITRGLNEMVRLGMKLGAQPLTFAGLAGVGDLVLTCTGELSRNRRLGLQLGRGMSLAEATADQRMVAEGVRAAKVAHALAEKHGLELPIIRQVYRVLHEGVAVPDALRELMARDLKPEWT